MNPRTWVFSSTCRDTVLALVERIRQCGEFIEFDAETAAAFPVGPNLLGEVMLKTANTVFEDFAPQLGQLMKRLKGRADFSSNAAKAL